jgi:hypothetical protein
MPLSGQSRKVELGGVPPPHLLSSRNARLKTLLVRRTQSETGRGPPLTMREAIKERMRNDLTIPVLDKIPSRSYDDRLRLWLSVLPELFFWEHVRRWEILW